MIYAMLAIIATAALLIALTTIVHYEALMVIYRALPSFARAARHYPHFKKPRGRSLIADARDPPCKLS